MTGYEFGDILLVPFPFTDQSTTKKRPAVVVSSSAYNLERPDLILLAVTSQVRAGTSFGECPVGQWQKAGLLKPSAIKPVVTAIAPPGDSCITADSNLWIRRTTGGPARRP